MSRGEAFTSDHRFYVAGGPADQSGLWTPASTLCASETAKLAFRSRKVGRNRDPAVAVARISNKKQWKQTHMPAADHGTPPRTAAENTPRPSGRSESDATAKVTVYFDGSCPLCTREIAHYRGLDRDGRLQFSDVSNANDRVAADLTRDAAMARFHVRDRTGHLLSGADAFIEIWRQVPRWRAAYYIARLPGARWLLERAYRLFLPARPLIVRLFRRPSPHGGRQAS